MKVLILSCNTGEGHNSTCTAIQEWLDAHGIESMRADALGFLSGRTSEIISKGHVFIYRRVPKLFGIGYKFEENHTPRFIYDESARGAKALLQFLEDNAIDTVICVHVFPALTMTAIRKRHPGRFRCYFVATDYTCSPGVSEAEMDAYFIPHESLRAEFAACGVPVDKLVVTGIPVRESFCTRMPRAEARRRLKLPENARVLLFSCGSMGCGPMKKLALLLQSRLPEDGYLVIICGSNRKLYHSLTALRGPCIRVVGFTKRMSMYMDAADVYLSKAGGLSTTEAIAKRLPLIYVDAIPGCELHNRDFMTHCGIAATAKGLPELAALACARLDDPAAQAECVRAMEAEFPVCGAAALGQFVVSDYKEHMHEETHG